MFKGLNAFPLTPLRDDKVDVDSYAGLISYLDTSGVDSITALGSTGSYAYLDAQERRSVARIAIDHAASVPVFVGVGSMRASEAIALAADAEVIGAAGVLIGPMSYYELTDEEVFGLYRELCDTVSIPVIVYDQPGGTPFSFSLPLLQRVAELPNIVAVKVSSLPKDSTQARDRIDSLRNALPGKIHVGISGDSTAATGLLAGADMWCSVIGGILPEVARRIARSAQRGDLAAAEAETARLEPIWDLMARNGGGYRVVAAVAELTGRAAPGCLPRPVRGLPGKDRAELAHILSELDLVTA